MKTYKLNEITDSKILYDKNPPRFIFMIVILVLILVSGFITWSHYSIRTYIVKGQGMVTKCEKSKIMAKVSGEIIEVNLNEGKKIKKGDVLLKVNPVESNLQLDQAKSQIEILTKRINLLARAESEATKNVNTFNNNIPEEAEFYNKLLNSYIKKKEFKVDTTSLKSQGYTDWD